ncbi:AsmA family protein [Vibrio sp. V39_P1S14PM300]|uniref:AsmA family protein n=1 Tax=Vibrio sp. V39_P1S14PM300 TaxID=1938690 RepID=UPI001372E288|nr:AsmA family protein [Vibrio sp. V39_P1S14PM300]NAX21929.1 AsmA family protein [Vibrio sp. V39_P1S14PM300]
MRKVLALLVAVIGLGLVVILVLFALLHTTYLTPLTNQALAHSRFSGLSAESVEYQYPLHLTLNNATYRQGEQTWYLPQLAFSVSPRLVKAGKLALDTLLIDGLNIRQPQSLSAILQTLDIGQLALQHLDLASGALSARDVDVQIAHPEWHTGWLPYGTIQLSAAQLYYQGEALNQLLIDADYRAQNSTVYGASFRWRNANVSGQAEQYPHGWSLVNVTVSGLDINDADTLDHALAVLAPLHQHVSHINSLDLLSSSFTLAGAQFNNLDASLENLDLTRSWWQQSKGYLSFDAESIDYLGQQLISATAKLHFDDDRLTVDDFDADFKQGRVQLSGTIRPHSATLQSLQISGIKWLEDTPALAALAEKIRALQQLSIAQLDINRSQIIQLDQKPYWQLSGLNVDGQQLELIRNGQPGLWNGELEISANSLSYGPLIASQGVVNTHSQKGDWQLERLFIPLEQGYIEGSGRWQLNEDGAPWQLTLSGDGLPLASWLTWFDVPLTGSGLSEFNLDAQGLSASRALLTHSLSGQLSASVREGHLALTGQPVRPPYAQDFTLEQLTVSADRGRLTLRSEALSGPQMTGSVRGEIDLVNPSQGHLWLRMHSPCQRLDADLVAGDYQAGNPCQPMQPAINTPPETSLGTD